MKNMFKIIAENEHFSARIKTRKKEFSPKFILRQKNKPDRECRSVARKRSVKRLKQLTNVKISVNDLNTLEHQSDALKQKIRKARSLGLCNTWL